ncbi:MAG: hypothetical protein IPI04_19420 [Ignavibacteria bacterium]|nr:hypothetical protein [Ignavibacteria bacterium]
MILRPELLNNPPNAQLPVELTSFNSNTSDNNVYLHWTTSSELNNYGFEIQRKNSGNTQWQLAGFVPEILTVIS